MLKHLLLHLVQTLNHSLKSSCSNAKEKYDITPIQPMFVHWNCIILNVYLQIDILWWVLLFQRLRMTTLVNRPTIVIKNFQSYNIISILSYHNPMWLQSELLCLMQLQPKLLPQVPIFIMSSLLVQFSLLISPAATTPQFICSTSDHPPPQVPLHLTSPFLLKQCGVVSLQARSSPLVQAPAK